MRTILVIVMILSSCSIFAQYESLFSRPRIIITGEILDPDASSTGERSMYLAMFEEQVALAISKEFPCADVKTTNDIHDMIEHDRKKSLLDPSRESNLQEIGKAMECDIIISLSVNKLGNTYYMGGKTMSPRKIKVLGEHNSKGTEPSDQMKNVIHDLINELAAAELCPYKGEFKYSLTIESSDHSESHELPGSDCKLLNTMKEENKTTTTWTFKKVRRIQAEASVYSSIKNYKLVTEESNCYHCQVMEGEYLLDQFEPNRTQMSSSDETTLTYEVTEIGFLDPTNRWETYHGVVKIIFNTLANNYNIQVKAFSKPGKYREKTIHKASGCPYHKNNENEIGGMYPIEIDRTFGPFTGSPFQKELKQNISNTERDKDGKTTTTETISFSLTR